MTVLMYIILCLIWGSTWMAIKIGLSEAPPLITAAVRFILATSILAVIIHVRGYEYPRGWKSIARLGYPGIYMYGASYSLVYFAEQHIDSALAAVLFAVYPFFVAVLSWLRFRTEKLGALAWAGMVASFLGVVIISFNSMQLSGSILLGTVLAIAAPFAAAWGIVIHKQYHSEQNIVVAATVQMLFGGTLVVIGAILFESVADFKISVASVGSIVYLAIFGTIVTFLGYYWLLKRIRLTTASLIAFVTPLVAMFIGIGFGGELFSTLTAVGSVLILCGVLLAVKK